MCTKILTDIFKIMSLQSGAQSLIRILRSVMVSDHIKEYETRNVNASNCIGVWWSEKNGLTSMCSWNCGRCANILWILKWRNLISRTRLNASASLITWRFFFKTQCLTQQFWGGTSEFTFLMSCNRYVHGLYILSIKTVEKKVTFREI